MRLAGDDPAAIRQVREMLERQVRQLGGIVDDLIDVSRIIEKKIDAADRAVAVDERGEHGGGDAAGR